MSELISLDIIIPVFGRPDLLQKCIDSIFATVDDVSFKLILVDDASPKKEEMEPIYKELKFKARIERNPENLGFPATCNKGVKVGYAPLILLVNSDIELKPGCVRAMLNEMSDPNVAVVGARLLFPEDEQHGSHAGTTQHCGQAYNMHAQIIHPCIGWRAGHPRTMRRRDDLSSVTGALFLTRRTVWQRLGGFDIGYAKGTFEEVEFCTRAKVELNGKIVYTPDACAIHHAGASAVSAGVGFPVQANRLRFLERCGAHLVWNEFTLW